MKEIIVYEAMDGKRFDSKDACMSYDVVINRVREVLDMLKPAPDTKTGFYAVKQDKENVLKALSMFAAICGDVIPTRKDVFYSVADGGTNQSHMDRILSDYSVDYPILYENFYRFKCINYDSWVEYPQQYYALNEDKFNGEIK